MRLIAKRDLAILSRFQELLKKDDNFGEIMEELNKLIPPIYGESLCLRTETGTKFGPGNLFTWLVMNGIVIDPSRVLKSIKCSIEIDEGELGLAGPVATPFFQPNLINY